MTVKALEAERKLEDLIQRLKKAVFYDPLYKGSEEYGKPIVKCADLFELKKAKADLHFRTSLRKEAHEVLYQLRGMLEWNKFTE